MRRSTRLFSLFLLAISLRPALAFSAPPGESALTQIRKALPQGWSAAQDLQTGTITIHREQPTSLMNTAPNPPPDQGLTEGNVGLILYVDQPETAEQFAAAKKENEDRAQALELLKGLLKDVPENNRNFMGNGDEYDPKNPDQQQRVDAYRAAARLLRQKSLPTMFVKDGALQWGWENMQPIDPAVQSERDAVVKLVESLFSPKPLN